jgi:hypothetical protein
MTQNKKPSWLRSAGDYILALLLSPLFILAIPLLVVLIIGLLLYGWFQDIRLGLRVRKDWLSRGKSVLFVYSDSPNFKGYVESNILPKIGERAMILNWSERSRLKWDETLEARVFWHSTGVRRYFEKGKKKWAGEDYCPLAIVFTPWWSPKVIRFWQAFKEFKHGKDAGLKQCEKRLFELLELPVQS